MNISATTDLRHGKPNPASTILDGGDDFLLVHAQQHISNHATSQQQSCKVKLISNPANAGCMDGFEADTLFVRDLCRWAKMAPSALAKQAGMAATTILRPYNGTADTRLSQPTLDKLRAKFPEFPGWNRDPPDQAGMLGPRADPNEKPEELVYLRQVDIEMAMGAGAIVDDYPSASLIPFNLSFIRSITKTPTEKLVVFGGHGESMEPTLLRGDLLMFDTDNRHPTVSDQIWAFHYAGGGMIKRLRRIIDDGRERYLLISDNPLVPDQKADIEDVHIVGKLVWVGRRM